MAGVSSARIGDHFRSGRVTARHFDWPHSVVTLRGQREIEREISEAAAVTVASLVVCSPH